MLQKVISPPSHFLINYLTFLEKSSLVKEQLKLKVHIVCHLL